MRVRPERIFPGDDFLDSIPEVVEQILDSPDGGFSSTAVERLRELARLRMRQFVLPEQIFAQLSELEEIVFDALEEEFSLLESPPDWREAMSAGRAISRNLSRACTLVALTLIEELDEERRSRIDDVTDFTQIINHELRDPLSAAFAAARVLSDVGGHLPEENRQEILDTIPRNIHRAIQLLESIRSLRASKPVDGERGTRARNLRLLVEELMQEVDEHARKAEVDLRIENPLPDERVEADRTALILHNLILNAIKYSDPAKEDRWVRIEVEEDRGSALARPGFKIRVRDNGVGIEREDQARVFERFYRVGQAGISGSGLGLVIARQAARQLGSEIHIESVPGEGSTFSFFAPCPRRPGSAD